MDEIENSFEEVKRRSIGIEAELRALEGGAISWDQFTDRLRISAAELSALIASHRIFCWPEPTLGLPSWQIYRGGLLPALADILEVFRTKDAGPYAIANFVLSESVELAGKRPLDLLRRGRVREVVAAAKRYGEMGA